MKVATCVIRGFACVFCTAALQVGARPDSQRYIAMKKKRATECGFASFHKVHASVCVCGGGGGASGN